MLTLSLKFSVNGPLQANAKLVQKGVLDLESDIQGFNTHWGNILLLEFLFSHSKAPDANVGITNVVCL